ncbi:hypothetical protein GIB67_022793 [Kingdonia uniflora]|uniref:Beta-amylase n=1 Tax=Kingdonia uniflora TaxID=39325 RepID=A0A7J7P762_9MAGN|nr:hypothetical protein GIB67_022793 [Kingdonia uniflora]
MSQEIDNLVGTSDDNDLDMIPKDEEDGGGIGEEKITSEHDHEVNMMNLNRYQHQENNSSNQSGANEGGNGRRSRPREEKERTKLRERHRRAITARILAGLRKHGNYNLRVRADINDVIGALAREAGWVVLPDGTTFLPRSQNARIPATLSNAAITPSSSQMMVAVQTPTSSLGGVSHGGVRSSGDYQHKNVYVPPSPASPYDAAFSGGSLTVPTVGDGGFKNLSSNYMVRCNQYQERDFGGTPHVPVYVMLPLGIIDKNCDLVEADSLLDQLRILKSIQVDGVMIDCWWGIVESHEPKVYKWSGYRQLFEIIRELNLKLQVVMSFHKCGGNVGDDVCIPLPHWILEVARTNPDIFFIDREGRANDECLSWGIDSERVLRGRTALEVYHDFMRSFRVEFEEFFQGEIISKVEVGLGPCGELRYPSYVYKHGWRYPGIGEFQCYDRYLTQSLKRAAVERGHPQWGTAPETAGHYKDQPQDTEFFREGGGFDTCYGRFFLSWYSQVLIDHGDHVFFMAKMVFRDTPIAAKLSGVHWFYKTDSHAAELTAGFYNTVNRDGYYAIVAMLKKYSASLNFSCVELGTLEQSPEAMADPEALVRQVLNTAWDANLTAACENALCCYHREGYDRILKNAKPKDDPDGRRHVSAFTYLRLHPDLLRRDENTGHNNFLEFADFVMKMHGEAIAV